MNTPEFRISRKLLGIVGFVVLSLAATAIAKFLLGSERDIVTIDDQCYVKVAIRGNGLVLVGGERITLSNVESRVADILDDNPGCAALVDMDDSAKAQLVVDVVDALQRSGIEVTVGSH